MPFKKIKGAKGNKTYELPPGVGPQLFAEMAAALGLRLVKQTPTRITVTGHEGDHAVLLGTLSGALSSSAELRSMLWIARSRSKSL